MKSLSILSAIFISSLSFGQEPSFEWAKQMGGTGSDKCSSITVDDSGNIYSAGEFSGTVDFDPGAGTNNLTAQGYNDVFVQKLDASGNFLWARSFGGNGQDFVRSITVDDSGNIYSAGEFSGTVDFDPGAGTNNLTSQGAYDVFIQKLDPSGNFIWAKQMGSGDTDYGWSIAIDEVGNVYTTGVFKQTVDFDPGTGIFNLTSAGGYDVFVQKLDAAGNFIWTKSFGGAGTDFGRSIDIDDSGNIYSTGYFEQTVDFDPGVGNFSLTSQGNKDIYIQKLDTNGNLIWVDQMGGTSVDEGFSITVDGIGNIYSIGRFAGTADFNPGLDVFNLTSLGGSDMYIQKLDSNGNFVWTKQMGGTSFEWGESIDLDGFGNIYSTGRFYGTTDFDPGSEVFNLTPQGNCDIFVLKLNNNGNFVWAKQFGDTSGGSGGESIVIDDNGNVYSSGFFSGTVDFDPGSETFNLSSFGSSDIYIQKLEQCLPNVGTDIQVACDSYNWIDGITYTASTNTPTWTLTGINGCDSTVTLNLTIINSNTNSQIVTECDSYTWNTNGQTYTQSGQYTEILTNEDGCDSTVTLNLTITNSNSSSESITECDSYTWSTNGQTYTESGQYTETLSNQSGCDSTVTLDLTINYSSSSTQTQTGIDSYTWSVNNETYTESGSYSAVIQNSAGCDSSITLDLTIQFTTGLNINQSYCVAVYPNPTFDSFTLSTKDMTNMNYTLLDLQGKVVLKGKIESTEETVDISNLSRGQYNLVFGDESISPISIIKN